MRSLAAGKHVLVEKPFTRNPAHVEEAWDDAACRGLVLVEGYMWRHAAQTRLLVELLPRIGRLEALHIVFFGKLPPGDDVRYSPELGGGALLDLGCYCVSAARLIVGREPDRVYGEAVAGRRGVDESFTGLLRFGELAVTFSCGFATDGNPLEAIGADGVLSVPATFDRPLGLVLVDGAEHRVPPGDPYLAQLDDFCAAVRGERPPLLGRDDALGQARALDGLLRSAGAGVPVEL